MNCSRLHVRLSNVYRRPEPRLWSNQSQTEIVCDDDFLKSLDNTPVMHYGY